MISAINDSYPHMPEFYQAVKEVAEDVLADVSRSERKAVWRSMRYLAEPDHIVNFRVNWQDDNNQRRVNRGYRIQFSNVLGPYKGGLRFAPEVNLSVLQFLGFEQTFKNSLTGLPMGGAKGGSDFDPNNKSESEIRRFCQSLMTQLARHIGPDRDIPAGDMGVGIAEIAYLFDQYRAITGKYSGVITGKHPVFGGSCFREEATGYGCVYFAKHVLNDNDRVLEGKSCAVSGAGNVALHTAKKLIAEGAKVISVSNRKGTLHFPNGLELEILEKIKSEQSKHGDLVVFAEKNNIKFYKDTKPWSLEPQLAFACAAENELTQEDAKSLVKAKCEAVFEGANMPCTAEALACLSDSGIIVAPSKAVNAGGVAVSGLEITQNRSRTQWTGSRVDKNLREIMSSIHQSCVEHGTGPNGIDYKKGANIAAFKDLHKAIQLYGLV